MAKTQRRTRRKRTYRSKRPKHTRKRTRRRKQRKKQTVRRMKGGANPGGGEAEGRRRPVIRSFRDATTRVVTRSFRGGNMEKNQEHVIKLIDRTGKKLAFRVFELSGGSESAIYVLYRGSRVKSHRDIKHGFFIVKDYSYGRIGAGKDVKIYDDTQLERDNLNKFKDVCNLKHELCGSFLPKIYDRGNCPPSFRRLMSVDCWIFMEYLQEIPRNISADCLKRFVECLTLCHSNNLYHLDIKLDNARYRENSGDIVLIDFDNASCGLPISVKGGTPQYFFPGYRPNEEDEGKTTDITDITVECQDKWSFALMLCELLLKKPLYEVVNSNQLAFSLYLLIGFWKSYDTFMDEIVNKIGTNGVTDLKKLNFIREYIFPIAVFKKVRNKDDRSEDELRDEYAQTLRDTYNGWFYENYNNMIAEYCRISKNKWNVFSVGRVVTSSPVETVGSPLAGIVETSEAGLVASGERKRQSETTPLVRSQGAKE